MQPNRRLPLVLRRSDRTLLGHDAETGEPFWWPHEIRGRHLRSVGISGSGKSFSTALNLVVQDLLGGYHGHAVIDPVGTLFYLILGFLGGLWREFEIRIRTSPSWAHRRFLIRTRDQLFSKIHVIDIADPNCPVFWNPIEKQDGLSCTEVGGDMARVVGRILGSDQNETLRRQTICRSFGTLLSQGGAFLSDATQLASMDGESLRRVAGAVLGESDQLGCRFVREYLELFFAGATGNQRSELTQSSWNWIGSLFLMDDAIARFISRPSNLDLSQIVNGGGYLYVHVPGRDYNTRATIGSLLLQRIATIAAKRDKRELQHKSIPFSVIMDEAWMLFGKELAQELAFMRNYQLNMILLHQTDAQFLGSDGDSKLLDEASQNVGTTLSFRLGERDAERASYSIFKPKGLLVKVVEREQSKSVTDSVSVSFMRQVSVSISRAVAQSKTVTLTTGTGQTFTVGLGKNVTVVSMEGTTLARGKGWTRAVSNGVAVTQSESQTDIQSEGRSHGTSSGETESEMEGEGYGTSSSESTGSSTHLTFNDGTATGMPVLTDGHFMGMRVTEQQGRGRGSGESSGKAVAEIRNTHHAKGRSLATAVSDAISVAESRALGKSSGKTVSRSVSTAESLTESEAKTISKAVGLARSYTEAVGRSIQSATGESRGRTETRTTGFSRGESTGVQAGRSTGRSVAEKTVRYSLDEEARIRAWELENTRTQHAHIHVKETGETRFLRMCDVPKFETKLGRMDCVQTVLDAVRPPEPKPPLGALIDRLLHTALPPPGTSGGAEGL